MKLSKDGKGILYITIFLTIFGIIMVLSSSWPTAVSEHRAWYYYGLRQGIFALLGFIFMKFTSVFNNENYKKCIMDIYFCNIIVYVGLHTVGKRNKLRKTLDQD